MKGPQGKGHAELAVTKPKGSGVETPTSEPGVSMTDLWDTDWEDEPQDMLMYRHQRRLSDPSANFNTFMNSGWRAKPGCEGGNGRSRSENEGLDSFADGLYEIESGDVRDACSCHCCNVSCGGVSVEKDEDSAVNKCPECQHFHCSKVDEDPVIVEPSSKVKILNKDADLNDSVIPDVEIKQSSSKDIGNVKVKKKNSVEIEDIENGKAEPMELKPLMSTDKEVPDVKMVPSTSSFSKTTSETCINTSSTLKKVKSLEERSDLLNDLSTQVDNSEPSLKRSFTLPKSFKKPGTAVRLPTTNIRKKKVKLCTTGEKVFYRDLPMTVAVNEEAEDESDVERVENLNLNPLLKTKTEKIQRKVSIPWRKTPNGTTINFLSDIKLDDGAYNPLWSTRGFTQTFHFWKENKRAQSVPLNAYLTYITLPWYSIISDILDHETGPILTF